MTTLETDRGMTEQLTDWVTRVVAFEADRFAAEYDAASQRDFDKYRAEGGTAWREGRRAQHLRFVRGTLEWVEADWLTVATYDKNAQRKIRKIVRSLPEDAEATHDLPREVEDVAHSLVFYAAAWVAPVSDKVALSPRSSQPVWLTEAFANRNGLPISPNLRRTNARLAA